MRKKSEINDTERAEFRSAMRGVTPIKHRKLAPTPPPKKQKIQWVDKESSIEFSDYEKLEPVTGEEYIEFVRPGIHHKVLRKLRTGQYNVDAILDLHGMNAEQARQALSEFLLACQEDDRRHALVIHGKGRDMNKPVLKNKLNHWLRQADQVLAFCSATKHGRGGALYLLLKGK